MAVLDSAADVPRAGPANVRRLLIPPAIPLVLLLPSVFAALLFALYYRAQPHWLADPDAQDYAQLGRQMASGRGPTTYFMPWDGLDYLHQRGEFRPSGPWPNIVRFPFVSTMMAATFITLGTSDHTVHLPDAIAYVLAAGCAGLLASRAYGAWAGFLAGLSAAVLPLLLNYSLTGLTEPTLGLLLLATLVCLVGGRSGRVLALGGALFGLSVLTRYDSALAIVPIATLWLLPRRDWRRATALFCGAAILVVLPWSAYLTVVAGTPLFNLQAASIAAQSSGMAGGLGWYVPRYTHPLDVWRQDPARTVNLMLIELAATPNILRKLLGWPWLLAGAAACLVALARLAWHGWWRPGGLTPGQRLVLFLLSVVLLKALTVSVVGLNLQRYYVQFVPLLLVVVVGEAHRLLAALAGLLAHHPSSPDIQPDRPRLVTATLVLGRISLAVLLLAPSIGTIGPLLLQTPGPEGGPTRGGEVEARPENLSRLAEMVGPGRVVASNVPWSVAWQADRPSVPLPPTVAETAMVEQRYGLDIDAIYVAGQVSVVDAPRSWREWDDLRRQGKPPPGYVLAESFANGGRLFVKER
jgi:hypothetical protein